MMGNAGMVFNLEHIQYVEDKNLLRGHIMLLLGQSVDAAQASLSFLSLLFLSLFLVSICLSCCFPAATHSADPAAVYCNKWQELPPDDIQHNP